MGMGDIIYRTVETQVESIVIDLSTQRWTLGEIEVMGEIPGRFRFQFIYWPDNHTYKIAYGTLTLEERGLVAELPWHFSPSDFFAHRMGEGLQIEGSVPTHDDVLAAVVCGLVRHKRLPRGLKEIFSDPDLLVHGFEKALFPYFTLNELRPIRINEEWREVAHTILRSLADGCGKGGAVAHLHCKHRVPSSKAYQWATSLMEKFPIMFCRRTGRRYHLSRWGERVLSDITRDLHGGGVQPW